MTRINQLKVDYSVPEPMPKPNDNPSIHDLLIKDIEDRKQFGLDKYGTLLQAGNGRKGLVDLLQELLDGAAYCRVVMEEQNAIIKALLLLVQQNLRLDGEKTLLFHWHIAANENAIWLLESLGYVELSNVAGECYEFTDKAIQIMAD